MMTIRSKRNSKSMTSLDIVSRAAAKHMRKVAASTHSPMTDAGALLPTTGTSNFSFSSHSSNSRSPGILENDIGSSNSEQTLVAGNRTSRMETRPQASQQPLQQQEQPASQQSQPPMMERIVAESPPVLISPTKNSSSTKPRVARSLDINDPKHEEQPPGSVGSASKRKSTPKRKVSSIRDNLALSPVKPISTRAQSSANGTSRSPRPSGHQQQQQQQHNFLSEHSRDRSNSNSASTSNKKPRILLPPANNKRIHDFFSSTSKKKPLHQPLVKSTSSALSNNISDHKPAAAGANNNNITHTNGSQNNKNQSIADINVKTARGTSATAASTATARTSTKNSVASSAALFAAKAAAEEWQAKCVKLQQQLQDKDEQLKAVTGNKTILHTALQQALAKTKKELQEVKESTASKTEKVNVVLEETLRWKFEKQAKELRATLSADGNRLGRIVSTRAGMRVIDSWEEGYASMDWKLRKKKFQSKHRALLQKQQKLKRQLNAQAEGMDKTNDTTTNNDSYSPSDNTTTVLTPLEVREAQESMQMHMEALLREEKELVAEEQTLNDEKGAHIRALKRVASEDASRFRNRTKLHDRYVLDCLLGKGGFSEVWKGYDLRELREVAVKIHQLDPRWPDSKKENYTKHVSREYEIHRNVRHSRIVSLYDVFEIDNNSFATVLECCKGTDLDTLLKRKKRLPERQARAILLQILTGMQYLSQPSDNGSRQGIIHYDLKPGNILFDECGDAKITDFGLSKIVDTPDPAESMELTSQGAGTYWYLPPECFVTGEQVRISNKVDVWSIGVIFYQMLYGQRPFGEGKSQDKLLADHTMLNAEEVHLPDKPPVSQAGKDFVKQCLTYDQAFRPTIAQLCENTYVLQKGP